MGFLLDPYSSFGGASGVDSPDDVSGLLVWFKADSGVFSDAGSTPATNGDTVQQWNDQSGNAIHSSQATSGSRPTYRTNQINGLPAIDFATSKWMAFTEQSLTDFSIFVVAKQGSVSTTKTIIGGTDNTTKINLRFESFAVRNSQHTIQSFEEAPTTDYVQICVNHSESAGGTTTLRVDECQTGTPDTGTATLGVSHLGARLNSGTATEFLNGLIAEVIIYNTSLSATDRAAIEAYLRNKYALPNPAQTLTDPTTITGCKLWLKADSGVYNDAGTTLATNGQTVQQWNDQSGNGNNATQSTSGSRPTYQTSVLNSLPVIRLDGSDDSMQVPSITVGTLVIVHKYRTSGNYPNFKTPFNDRTAVGGRIMVLQSGAATLWNDSSNAINNRHFRNGSLTNSLAPIDSFQISAGSFPGNTTTDACDIGRDDQNNARCWDGDIAEIIVYDRGLSVANRVRLQNYLNTKYAIF